VTRAACVCLFAGLLQACVTRDSVKNAPVDAGILGIYKASGAAVLASAVEALRETNFAVAEDEPARSSSRRVLATGYAASGESLIARVTVEDRGVECAARVYVASRRGSEAADADVARSIHERMARRLDLPAPPPPLPPATESADGVERTYRSMLTLCFDGAIRACRERDYGLREEKRTGDHTGAIRGEGKAFTIAMHLHRRTDNRTRVIVSVQGRSPAENRDEAMRLLERLREELKEIAE